MSESVVYEVWENQKLQRNVWCPYADHPWTRRNYDECCAPDEIKLPSVEWCWVTNWRIDSKAGMTDAEGWEYASKFNKFRNVNRKPKIEKHWGSKFRRRLWCRVSRRDTGGLGKIVDIQKALPRIQQGLSSIHLARLRIEEIVSQAPDSINSEQMKTLVDSVKKNICDIISALDQYESQQTGSQTAIVNKLRNDVTKEEVSTSCPLNA